MHDHPHSHSHGHHDHHHDHDHGHHKHGHDHHHHPLRRGHNHGPVAGQWQMPHLPEGAVSVPVEEQDLDLVETSFVEGFQAAKDPTSFLRLANIPFVGMTADGQRLHLLRVETGISADVGSVTPSFGGGAVHYDPLPAQLVQQRRDLAFIYHDGRAPRRLSFAEARRLSDVSAPSKIVLASDANE